MIDRLHLSRELILRITAWFVMLFVFLALSGLLNKTARAVSPPNVISYQGRVLNANGVPVSDATVSMKFEIYTAASGGTCLWSNSSANCDSNTPASTTARTVTLTDGLFTARLGDTSDTWAAIADSVFADNASLYLQVYIAGETLTPRKALDAVPYALNAETLDGLSSADFDLDQIYDNDSDKILNVDTSDLEFSLDASGLDFIVDMQSDGDFVLQDAGTAFFTISDSRQISYTFNGSGDALNFNIDTLTDGNALDISLNGLTVGTGIDVSSDSKTLTSATLISADHTTIYTSGTTSYTGKGLNINRDITSNGGSTTVTLDGPFATITSSATTANGGTLTESGPLFSVNQNNTSATGAALRIDANHTGGPALAVDSEATTGNAVNIAADVLTTGSALRIIGSDFTDDVGLALEIDTKETTASADIFTIQTDFGTTNNNVFRIEADGEVFSDIGFTAGAFSTNYLDGELQTTGDYLLDIDGGDLTFDQNTIIGDGGDALTINSSGTLTIDDTILAATDVLDIRSGGSANLTLNSASGIVSTASGDDFAVGAAGLTAAFSIDESANTMRLGDGSGTNATINLYSSGGDTGALTYQGDQFSFTGGNFSHIGQPDYGASPGSIYMFDAVGNTTAGASGSAGTYQAIGVHSSFTTDVAEGAGTSHEAISVLGEAINLSSSGQVENLYGGYFKAQNNSSNASAVGTAAIGALGQVENAASVTVPQASGLVGEVVPTAGSITTARGVYGIISGGSGAVGTGLGGDFINTQIGTSRYGVRAAATGGTNNYAGYFYAAPVHIENTVTPSTAGLATGGGDLFVWDALEVDGSGTTTGAVLQVDASTNGFMASFINGGDNDNRQGLAIGGCLNTSPTAACNLLEFRDGNGSIIGAVEGDGAGGVTSASSGSDYAELFNGTYADFAEGNVVALDASGQAVVASDPTDVIGVLSIAPNTLGNWVEDWRDIGTYVPVALLGQVPVNVNTEGGSISAGDYIALSSTNGVAKKATGVGYVLGRALESHSSGTGTIEVFIQPGWHGLNVLTDDAGDVAVSSAIRLLGNTDDTLEMTMFTDVTDSSDYRLSIENADEDEVAFINNEGNLAIAGKLYPSDRGVLQTNKYIYYDGSSGPGGDFMRTNASGWGSGSYDFAEMFPSNQSLAAGEVVVFADNKEHIMRSDGITYDQRIAGIVSTQPGFLAGDNIAGHVPVALSGRVPTYVSGENGAIAIGDPLTTSSKDGYAMKATQAGPIVGYAMEAFSGETGAISVFVRPSYYDGGTIDDDMLANNVISELATTATLDLSGTVNFNTGQIINIAAITGVGQQWSINMDGTIRTKGDIIQVVRSYQGEDVETYLAASRQHTIELSGTAQLREGAAAVNFEHEDALFNDIIATGVPYRVFLTADHPTGPLYAVNRDGEGFSIREVAEDKERSTAQVDWLVIAYHKDYAPEEEIAEDEEQEEETVTDGEEVLQDEVIDEDPQTQTEASEEQEEDPQLVELEEGDVEGEPSVGSAQDTPQAEDVQDDNVQEEDAVEEAEEEGVNEGVVEEEEEEVVELLSDEVVEQEEEDVERAPGEVVEETQEGGVAKESPQEAAGTQDTSGTSETSLDVVE